MKLRFVLACFGLAALTGAAMMLHADEPAGKSAKDSTAQIKSEVALLEQQLREQFARFELALLQLKQRLEKSSKQEDKDRAKLLEAALEEAKKHSVAVKFDRLVDYINKQKFTNLGDIKKTLDDANNLAENLQDILRILRDDSKALRLREERKRLEELLKQLEKVIHDQKIVQARTESEKVDPKELEKNQRDVRADTQQVARNFPGGEKDNKGPTKPGEAKGGKTGEAKNVGKTGAAPKAQGKDAGAKSGDAKPSEAKGGDPKAGTPGDPKAGEAKGGKGADAKGGKGGKGGDAKGGEAKPGNQGGEQKPAQAKDGGKDDKGAGIREKQKAEAKGDLGKKADPKQGEAKPGDPKAGGAKDAKGGAQAKSGDSKPGDSKGGDPKQGEAKSGSSSSGQGQSKPGQPGQGGESKSDPNANNNQKPQEENGKKQVQDADYPQSQAEQKIRDKKNKEASDEEQKAIDKLEAAKKKLEQLLKQIREEELERLLAALQARCEKMLAMQIAVLHGTEGVDKAILKQADKQPDRLNKQDSIKLSGDEKLIVDEADKAIMMLEAEGTAVAFPEVFQQVREDMRHVQRRLALVDVGKVTQAIEKDIIDTLNEMIEALKKAQKENEDKKSKSGKGDPKPQQPQDQKLLEKIAELKMIRSMQMRVNNRTKTYGQQYPGEQAADPLIRRELRELAGRQVRIVEVTNRIAKGDNK